jgi:hypothetical protein
VGKVISAIGQRITTAKQTEMVLLKYTYLFLVYFNKRFILLCSIIYFMVFEENYYFLYISTKYCLTDTILLPIGHQKHQLIGEIWH